MYTSLTFTFSLLLLLFVYPGRATLPTCASGQECDVNECQCWALMQECASNGQCQYTAVGVAAVVVLSFVGGLIILVCCCSLLCFCRGCHNQDGASNTFVYAQTPQPTGYSQHVTL